MLETEVCNEGVRYSDTFSLTMRYCLVQMSLTTTNLRVTAQITYIKSVNQFIKSLLFYYSLNYYLFFRINFYL